MEGMQRPFVDHCLQGPLVQLLVRARLGLLK
jgi:hypothetical protein